MSGPEVLSESGVEWSNVGNESSGNEGITNHGKLLLFEVLDVFGPTDLLVSQTVNETVGEGEVKLESVGIVLDSLLLGDGGVELSLEGIDLLDDEADLLLDDGELSKLLSCELLGGLGRLHQRLDLLVDAVVDDSVDDPIAQVGSCARLL